MRKGFLYALSFSMILASQSLTALAEDQAPTGTETPASSSDTGGGIDALSSEVTNEAGESEENPTVEAETKNGASDKEADEVTEPETAAPDNASAEETEKEESVPEETPVGETPVVPAPAAETENTPVAKAMAPMNAPVSQSTFVIGDIGYDTLDKALDAAQNTAGDVMITLTKDATLTGSFTIDKKDSGTITFDLGGNKLQNYSFVITLSSPIQMVIQNGWLQGTHRRPQYNETPRSGYDFVVTSSKASIVFQDLELDNIWAMYYPQDWHAHDDSYVFQILRCRNDTLEKTNRDGRYRGLMFGSYRADCKVLFEDSRLLWIKDPESQPSSFLDSSYRRRWWHTKVTLNNSILTGLGTKWGGSAGMGLSPVIANSSGGMLDQFNWKIFDGNNDPSLHHFYVAHIDWWVDQPKDPFIDMNSLQKARWTTYDQLSWEYSHILPPNNSNYNTLQHVPYAELLVPTKTVKIGVIFEEGHDYPDLGLTWKVATIPVTGSMGAFRSVHHYGYIDDRDYSRPIYFEETQELTGATAYDSYVPLHFYTMEGDALTVPAGAEDVTWSYTENPNSASPAADSTSEHATDTPTFQEVYDLVWNDPEHKEIKQDDGTTLLDYRLKAVRKTYSVDFDANGGTNDLEAQKSLRYYEDSIKAPETKDMTRDGYTFTGWYLDADATKKFNSFQLLDRNVVDTLTKEGALKDGSTTITLYAGWKKNEEKPAQPAQPAETAKPVQPSETAKPAQPSQTAKASSAPAASFPRTSNPVSSTGKLFIPRTGVGAEPKSAE